MPLTEKGEEIRSAMEKEYGSKKGEEVFYASKNKGTITGVDAARGDDWSPEAREAAAEARKKGGKGPDKDAMMTATKAANQMKDPTKAVEFMRQAAKKYGFEVKDAADLRDRADGVRKLCDSAAARMDEWSEEAREAAAEARKKGAEKQQRERSDPKNWTTKDWTNYHQQQLNEEFG